MLGERKVKRIRGWKKELQMANPCQKDEMKEDEMPSPMCTRLLQLWSQGRISATQACELAHMNVLGGDQHSEMMSLAKCGNFQESKGNCHRDLLAWCCRSMGLPQPQEVVVPMLDLKSQKEVQTGASILLPHLLFSRLSDNYADAFEKLFCTQHCQAFWHQVQHVKDPWLAEPLAKSGVVQAPAKTVPVFVHGDGCEFQNRDSLMTWSWGSLLSKQSCLNSHLLICAIPKSCTLPTTWPVLDAWIAWSFEALGKGWHPCEDPWGNPLPKGELASLAGKPLTKGHHRAALWSIQGDAEFYSNVLKVGHWASQYPGCATASDQCSEKCHALLASQ